MAARKRATRHAEAPVSVVGAGMAVEADTEAEADGGNRT